MNAKIGYKYINEESGKVYILAYVNGNEQEQEVKLVNLETGRAWSFKKTTVQDVKNIHPNELENVFGNGTFSRVN